MSNQPATHDASTAPPDARGGEARGEAGPAGPGDDYLLGSGDAELARLAFQHQVWASDVHALWRRAGFRRGQRLLDLGCGPGFATLDLAHLVGPEGRVVGLDGSERFLDHLRRRAAADRVTWIEAVHGDAEDPSLPAAAFEGAYARWLFCFLRRPERAAAAVAGALVPGGRLAVTDYFNYRAFTLAPRSAAFDRVVAAVPEAWRARGGDLEIQGRLPGLLAAAGLRLVDVHQSAPAARPGSPLWSWPETFFREFLPALVSGGFLTAGDEAAFWHDWNARAADPAAFLCLPPMIHLVAEKG